MEEIDPSETRWSLTEQVDAVLTMGLVSGRSSVRISDDILVTLPITGAACLRHKISSPGKRYESWVRIPIDA
jgi:hypothetical protein